MKDSLKKYCNNPYDVPENLAEVISNTDYHKNISNEYIKYYVVHKGGLKNYKGMESNEFIVNIEDLITLKSSTKNCVPDGYFEYDLKDNYNFYENNKSVTNELEKNESEKKKPKAITVNLSGYDLAKLSNKWTDTELGRNILFGQNMRDPLDKKSKTIDGMFKTINDEPYRFWYYNNGITIIAQKFDVKGVTNEENKKIDKVVLENFSIINGCQTVSTLGSYLKHAIAKKDQIKLDNLKQVFIQTRIVETQDDRDLEGQIALFNNTQNPITSRDLVSNRPEQLKLNSWLLEGKNEPNIYVEIRRGSTCPEGYTLNPHQKTNNELLAQLAFAGFYTSPFSAKDKKKSLFDINNNANRQIYNKIFYYDENNQDGDKNGILFKKGRKEIDELLFINHLHNLAKNTLRKEFQIQIELIKSEIADVLNDEEKVKEEQYEILRLERYREIINTCLFYNIAVYYKIREEFKAVLEFDEFNNLYYDYTKFYATGKNISNYKENLISEFADMFLLKTVEIIYEISGNINTTNWLRPEKSEKMFFEKLNSQLKLKNRNYKKDFLTFLNNFKNVVKV